MPSTSPAQHRFMEGIAHGMKPRIGKGPSVAVARDFVKADSAIASPQIKPAFMRPKYG